MKQTDSVYYDSLTHRRNVMNEVRDLLQYRNLLWQLTKRNLTVRYKRSFLGIMWTLLDPLLTMLVMTFVFTALLERNLPDFPVYLLTGIVVWAFFSQSSGGSIRDFSNNGRLISKINIPPSAFIVVTVWTGVINFFISLLIVLVVSALTGAPITLAWLMLPIPIFIFTLFTLGVCLILAPLGIYFADIQNIYSIFLRLMMYLSAIFYPVDILPDGLRAIVNLNPLYQFISIFRSLTYLGDGLSMQSLLNTSLWAFALFAVGILVFAKLSDDISLRI